VAGGLISRRLLGVFAQTLPRGFRLSRPTLDDAARIYELVAACDSDILGRPDVTLDDIADELVEPGFNRDTDGWLVHDPAGRLVAWAWACRKGDSDNVDVTVVTRTADRRVAGHLWPLVQRRAVEIARELGHDRVVMDTGAYRDDRHRREQLAGQGFEHAATFQRLRIDHDRPRSRPAAPGGVVVRNGAEGEAVRRLGHAVRDEAFAEHFGFVATEYADWSAQMEASASHDWAQLRVVTIGGEPAAMLLGTDSFADDENCGYVRTLGVRKAFRGRGLARFLLRVAFVYDAGRGRAGTYLHVDSVGAPALGLYLSEGMRQTLVMDVWRKTLPTHLAN
jgi:ribosomal protein S18 acetylase RimI-like enzyme